MEQEEEKNTVAEPEAPTLTFDEILEDKEYQREFDRRVSKALDTAKTKWQEEAKRKEEESEKLQKMKTEEKINYELEKARKENAQLKGQINSMSLQKEANSYAAEKGLPIGYIEDLDYSKETAETIKTKIDKLVAIRSNDLDGYLKDKLKQTPPKAVGEDSPKNKDPYLEGFDNYFAKK